MSIILEQYFLLGRFHATRWNQNPFEDRHGEWPPSPWRLLRTLASRWIQYSRETGDEDESARDELLRRMASQVPDFHLPPATWRGDPAVRQYHKTGVEWTAKGKKDAAYKKSMTTLVPDHYRAIAPDQPVIWIWGNLDLPSKLLQLLDSLLNRIVYFGRAETLCRIRRCSKPALEHASNCILNPTTTDGSPVLVATPDTNLNLSSLLASTNDKLLSGRSLPPGAVWFYAKLPQRPVTTAMTSTRPLVSKELNLVQFAVGGRVYPPLPQWIRITEQFRGIVLKRLARRVSNRNTDRFADLSNDLRARYSLLTGKSLDETPLKGHQHAYFVLVPDDMGQPTRLVCFRKTPFNSDEIDALMAASEEAITWQPGNRDWWIRLVPLPFDTPPPLEFNTPIASVWTSATPFVIPGQRKRFRENGRLRPGETPERLLEKLLIAQGLPVPRIEPAPGDEPIEWVAIHETREQRTVRRENRTRAVLPSHRFRLTFPEPVTGPICVGHSSHFGLGLFRPSING